MNVTHHLSSDYVFGAIELRFIDRIEPEITLFPETYGEWLRTTSSNRIQSIRGNVSALARKWNYEDSMSNIRSLENFLFKWEFVFPEYQFEWSFEFLFNFIIDLNLNFDLNFDLDLTNLFKDLFLDLGFDFEILEKAIFDKTKYELSYLDPPEFTTEDIRRYAFNLREKYLKDHQHEYRFMDKSMEKAIESFEIVSREIGFDSNVARYIARKILVAESKILDNPFVGTAMVEVSKVAHTDETGHGVGTTILRDANRYMPILNGENSGVVDTLVDYAMVGYSKVGLPIEGVYAVHGAEENKPVIPPELQDRVIENIDRGRLELGVIEFQAGDQKLSYLPARHRYLMSKDRRAFRGGIEQARMQNYTNLVKRILDNEGIYGNERLLYIAFANELLYLDHQGVRKAKQWKRSAPVDALIEKYISLGAKKSVLEKVVKICKPM